MEKPGWARLGKAYRGYAMLGEVGIMPMQIQKALSKLRESQRHCEEDIVHMLFVFMQESISASGVQIGQN